MSPELWDFQMLWPHSLIPSWSPSRLCGILYKGAGLRSDPMIFDTLVRRSRKNHSLKVASTGAFLAVQWLRLRAPRAGGLGLFPGQGTRFHMLQLETRRSQIKVINIFLKKLQAHFEFIERERLPTGADWFFALGKSPQRGFNFLDMEQVSITELRGLLDLAGGNGFLAF